jgi:hypothetical protein
MVAKLTHESEVFMGLAVNSSGRDEKLIILDKMIMSIQWGMQARASTVTKLTKVSGKQMDFLQHRKLILFFLRHGLSNKLDFGVINSLKYWKIFLF